MCQQIQTAESAPAPETRPRFSILKTFDDQTRYQAALISYQAPDATLLLTGDLAFEVQRRDIAAGPDGLEIDYQDGLVRFLLHVNGITVTDEKPRTIAVRCSILEVNALYPWAGNNGR